MVVLAGILIASGVVLGSVTLARGEPLRAALALFFGVGFGALLILWTTSFGVNDAEADPTGTRTQRPASTWREWLADYVVIAVFGVALAAELHSHGTQHPYAIVLISVFLVPFVVVQWSNFLALTARPSLWRFLLRWLDRLRFSVPLAAGAAAGMAIGESSDRPAVGFFEASAQLIPLLALVLAVEGRTYALRSGETPGRLILVVYTFAAMGVAEFICLRILAQQEVGRYDLSIVGAVLVTVFVSILLLALLGPIEPARDDSDKVAR
jgi:hypothetical protein